MGRGGERGGGGAQGVKPAGEERKEGGGGDGGTQGVKPAGVRGVNGEEAKYLGLGIDC